MAYVVYFVPHVYPRRERQGTVNEGLYVIVNVRTGFAHLYEQCMVLSLCKSSEHADRLRRGVTQLAYDLSAMCTGITARGTLADQLQTHGENLSVGVDMATRQLIAAGNVGRGLEHTILVVTHNHVSYPISCCCYDPTMSEAAGELSKVKSWSSHLSVFDRKCPFFLVSKCSRIACISWAVSISRSESRQWIVMVLT
jgi:hypothetical protein